MHKHSYCDDTGSHCTYSKDLDTSFNQYGLGIVLYFRNFKYLTVLTLIMSLLIIPVIVLYVISISNINLIGSVHYDAPITLHSINKNVLVKTTFGNLATQGYACTSGEFGSKANLNCTYGVIDYLITLGLTRDKDTCAYEVLESFNSRI